MDFDSRRKEAWEFFFRGYSVYDYLDFTIGTWDPRGEGLSAFPGNSFYDGTVMRLYLKHLKDFFMSLDFVAMSPDPLLVQKIPDVVKAFALSEKGTAYALYLAGSGLKRFTVDLPEGNYRVEWFNPLTGSTRILPERVRGGTNVVLDIPSYLTDIALKLERTPDEESAEQPALTC